MRLLILILACLPATGLYAGPAVIAKPLILEGEGQVVIDGKGHGTVLHFRASDVTLRGMHLRGSGDTPR